MEANWSNDDLFRFFVIQQQQTVMFHLGKLVHPVTGKIERDLDAARLSIDLLGMIEEKTRGNLGAEDERLLGQVLTTLRLNYLEEAKKGPQTSEEGAGGDANISGEDERGKAGGAAGGQPGAAGEASGQGASGSSEGEASGDSGSSTAQDDAPGAEKI